jgi:acyl-CoA synthetase (AMP-forming)/AMP-acid ligase II
MFRNIIRNKIVLSGKPYSGSLLRFNSSYIMKSKTHLPELENPDIVNTPLPHYVMNHFLNPDRINRVALTDGSTGKSLTFGDLHYSSYSFADSLKDLGIKPKEVVSIVSPNHLHYFPSIMGTLLSGGILSTVNPLYSAEEMSYQFQLTESKIIITHPMGLERVLQIAPKQSQVIVLDDGMKPDVQLPSHVQRFSSLFSTTPQSSKYDYTWSTSTFDPHQIAVIPFSSGTTGRSKGVMITHKNLVCNILQTIAYEGYNLLQDINQATLLIPLPFFHIFGFTAGMMVVAHVGARNVFLPQFDLQLYLKCIQEYQVQRSYVVPPILLALAKHPIVDKYQLSSLKSLMSGAAPLGVEIQKACAKRLNCIVKQAWGMTETSPAATITPDFEVDITNWDNLKATAGLLVPATEGKIIDPLTKQDISPYEQGELLVRGPQIMKGYWKNEEATQQTITSDGWLHTGDIAMFDKDGYLYITDRLKELIKYKGFQVPPAELEAIIASMEYVKDVIVIPVEDAEAGEIPRAYVVKKETAPDTFDVTTILDYVHSQVAPHKRLRGGVIFTDTIPKSASGKLLRRVQVEIDRQLHTKK